ncbi:hypothetical protein CLV30_101110 [Haloactinopolyspora alba]|uniref:Uncharacterized protein n=1 Tax=Haloactinopolyspora alba TaxID=648780 RepID=A0A2P8EFA7_9ACTN|nr:hypothetical protein [Haloactinopolyspora alba]PSL08143.1 hypothetical protein CLV30_101110 [Haloactinopolyspora alba]
MHALSDPEQAGYALAVAIVTFGGAGIAAFFYVSLTIGTSRGRGLGHLATWWLRVTSILFTIALGAVIVVAVYRSIR